MYMNLTNEINFVILKNVSVLAIIVQFPLLGQ